MAQPTKEAIVKALHDKGAYCGVCDYETALDGTPECSECREVLNGYADAILPLVTAARIGALREAADHLRMTDNAIPDPVPWLRDRANRIERGDL